MDRCRQSSAEGGKRRKFCTWVIHPSANRNPAGLTAFLTRPIRPSPTGFLPGLDPPETVLIDDQLRSKSTKISVCCCCCDTARHTTMPEPERSEGRVCL